MAAAADRRVAWGAVIAVLVVAAGLAWVLTTPRSRVVFEAGSEFGRVRVVEHADGLRTLHTGAARARQSAVYPGRPERLVSEYTQVAAIGLALAPPEGRVLYVGLGGGAMPMHARHARPHLRIDVVEIDPVIVAAAGRWFGFRGDERMQVHTGDGRAYIESAPGGAYDVVFLDAFSDDEIPFALTTVQFLEAVRRALAADGVVVSNLWTANPAHASMVATYAAVFEQVHFVRVGGRSQTILVAGSGARPLDGASLAAAARTLAAETRLGFDLARLVESGYEPLRATRAPLLEDAAPAGAQ
jgi:spermidine synthase